MAITKVCSVQPFVKVVLLYPPQVRDRVLQPIHHCLFFSGSSIEVLWRKELSEGGGQSEYDELVRNTGCAGREDSLQCLRQVDFDTFLYVGIQNLSSPLRQILVTLAQGIWIHLCIFSRALSQIEGPLEMQGALFRWGPRIDGEIITDTLYGSLSKGNCKINP